MEFPAIPFLMMFKNEQNALKNHVLKFPQFYWKLHLAWRYKLCEMNEWKVKIKLKWLQHSVENKDE